MQRSTVAPLALGLAIGLVIGLNVAGLWPQVPLHAVATHGQDNFAICTGPMDDNVEGVFVLDAVTGELKGAVLNVQQRRFNTLYEYNVTRDLPTPNTKNPQFRIVSGMTNIRQAIGSGQVGRSVIYVAEMTSGQLMAYGVPWLPGLSTSPIMRREPLVPLDRWQFRTTAVREN